MARTRAAPSRRRDATADQPSRREPETSGPESPGVVTTIVYSVPPAVTLALTFLGLVSLALALVALVGRRRLLLARLSASTDPLTGLPNHRAVYEQLARSVREGDRAGTPFAVVMIDLDDFKRINDNYGHLRGDEVLKGVSRTIRHELRAHDFVGRYGGEEFVAVLPATARTSWAATIGASGSCAM